MPAPNHARGTGAAVVRLYVVRHAAAGSRSSWDGIDATRPLSGKGRRQATALADRLGEAGIGRLVSSPAARCVETLEPLGERLGLTVDADSRLVEGARGEDALALADELRRDAGRNGDGRGRRRGRHEAVALCSHGDVIPDLLHVLRAGSTRIEDPLVWPKASAWLVTWDGTHWATASYLAPPQL